MGSIKTNSQNKITKKVLFQSKENIVVLNIESIGISSVIFNGS